MKKSDPFDTFLAKTRPGVGGSKCQTCRNPIWLALTQRWVERHATGLSCPSRSQLHAKMVQDYGYPLSSYTALKTHLRICLGVK